MLLVDDINDTGATLNRISQEWGFDRGLMTRVAVLYNNESSDATVEVDYAAVTINKANEDVWIVFPFEDWWTRR